MNGEPSYSTDPEGILHVSCPSDRNLIGDVLGILEDHLFGVGCPPDLVMRISIMVEEVFVNICDYAYGDSIGPVEITCAVADGSVTMGFTDSGTMFDPTSVDAAVREGDPSEWPVGGLGIHMVMRMADSVEYRYESERNVLTVVKSV